MSALITQPHTLIAWGIDSTSSDSRTLFVLIDGEAGNLLLTVGFQLRLELCAGAEAALAAGVKHHATDLINHARLCGNQFTSCFLISPLTRHKAH